MKFQVKLSFYRAWKLIKKRKFGNSIHLFELDFRIVKYRVRTYLLIALRQLIKKY